MSELERSKSKENVRKELSQANFGSSVLNDVRVRVILILALLFGFFGGLGGSFFLPQVKDVIEIGKTEITVKESSDTIKVAEDISRSVVSITGEISIMDFWGRVQQSESSGTGFIVTEDGLIITNKHVVSSEKAKYSVFTSDGKEYEGSVLATDPYFDIAFIKINANNLKPLALGNSDDLKIGQTVIAIGNALGQFDNTVTRGVVSALGRAIEAGDSRGTSKEVLENMIQTDAAINSGNSGGPLVNLAGQVIGINTAVASGAEGIGFAIPINVAKSALEPVQKSGKIIRPMIGIRYINITKDMASQNNLSVEHGALIYASGGYPAVLPGTPAAKAGLKEGDIITKIEGKEIKDGKSLITVLYDFKPGDEVTITYVRDGQEKKTRLVLSETK
ncbi:MAG: trypsin-like peptidase domain-containing protein [Patescibacteria group bacterium]|nr:trypsin-like peptidase domain-containing protein [Patescibacteria group bacterium]